MFILSTPLSSSPILSRSPSIKTGLYDHLPRKSISPLKNCVRNHTSPRNKSLKNNFLSEKSQWSITPYGRVDHNLINQYPPKPTVDKEICPPEPIPPPYYDIPSTSHITYIPSSPPSPIKILPSKKGKEPCISITPQNSPVSSPINFVGSDIDFLLSKKSLELHPLTIHKPDKPTSPHISPNSAKNITVRRKHNRGSRHFRGKKEMSSIEIRDLSLIDIPIIDLSTNGPLRESQLENRPS